MSRASMTPYVQVIMGKPMPEPVLRYRLRARNWRMLIRVSRASVVCWDVY